ncbi:hypothetical protein HNR42_000510 [Deinobacterium chartae]|uniref:Cytochrome c domain-containing protein n=1 Tax=Deinobacterium chartae TaxID=521158 RepID=A0A841HW04_9DEIO|nr:hypothetical protein [Deinobacterium chartae]MBB6097096.1 hypothetical protein [Deinobacterium chartae]
MKRPARFVAALLGLAGLATAALARPPYRTQAIAQFHLEGSPLKKSTMSCAYCHTSDTGGPGWNPFGLEVRAGFAAEPKRRIADVLYRVLQANRDADGDGYPDALEVFARTLPGDPASAPTETLADLEARFQAAGGVEQYAPGPARAR